MELGIHMNIQHKITLSVAEQEQAEFANVGIYLELEFRNFLIDESDEKWGLFIYL